MTCFFVIEMLCLFFVINTLSSARAYVGAEGLWTKAHKDGVNELEKYGATRNEIHYQKFQEHIKIPLGVKKARLELLKENPDLNIAKQGFLEGKNHPEDIEGMVNVFLRFHSFSFFKKTIAMWASADNSIEKLIQLANALHAQINSPAPSEVKIKDLLHHIELVNVQLTNIQNQFSFTLGNGARWLENLIMSLFFFMALTIVAIRLFITVSIAKGISNDLNEIIISAKKIAKGDFSRRAKSHSKDEIGELVHSFNKMTDELESNINELKLSEKKVRVSERALAEAQRLCHIGSWEWDLATNKITWSDELYRIFGLHHHEFKGTYKSFIEHVHPDDLEYVKSIVETADTQKKGINYVHRIIRKNDGAVRLVNGRGRAIIENGITIKFMGTAQDITEKEHAEEKIRKSQAALMEAQHLAHLGSWEWSVNTNKVLWSDELYHIYGLDPHEFDATYEAFLECVYPEDKQYVDQLIKDAGKKKKPLDYFHRIIRKRDGKIRMLQCYGRAVLNEKGELVKITGTAQDVTEAKQNEDRIKQLSLIASESKNGILVLDKYGKVEWVNDGFVNLSGYTSEDLIGTSAEILRKGEATGHKPGTTTYETLLREKKPVIYEAENYTKDGHKYWAQTTLSPLLDENGNIHKIIAIDSDITKLKQTEKELINAKEKAEQSKKIKEEFLANMSHEIRTPMNGIIGFARLLEDSPLTESQKEYLSAIKTSGSNLLVIINEILDFSKLEAGKVVFEERMIDLYSCIESNLQMLQPKVEDKNIKLKAHFDKDIPHIVLGDQVRLSQVLINLISNAIKFTREGEICVSARLLNQNPECAEIEFCVHDTGIGIPEKKLELIFESFSQASSNTTRKYGGTGLGLTISKKLIELQGGHIEVKSEVNKGSDFIFTLKFKKYLDSECDDGAKEGKKVEFKSLKKIKILLVEDNKLNQLLASRVLENWHTKPDIASNGKIAIKKIEEGQYDLILMDIQMPEMDGYEATIYIRKNISKELPIIAMTANAMVGEKEKCLQAGLNDCISKPFDLNELYSKIIQYTHAA